VNGRIRSAPPGAAGAWRLTAGRLSAKVPGVRQGAAVLKSFIAWYLAALDAGGYTLVAALMALESSVVPLPSEVVIPPAAHLAFTTGRMSLWGIVIAGTIGSWVGASVMYGAARLLGRPLLRRYGGYVGMSPAKLADAEAWSEEFGPYGVFASRLLPVVRHVIGIPAGIVRLNFLWFSIATLAGSAIWTAVLCWVGVTAGQDEALMAGNLHRLTLWAAAGVVALGLPYWLLVHRVLKRARAKRG
jgi:membrane protein DedA with SNARE-associated domain